MKNNSKIDLHTIFQCASDKGGLVRVNAQLSDLTAFIPLNTNSNKLACVQLQCGYLYRD